MNISTIGKKSSPAHLAGLAILLTFLATAGAAIAQTPPAATPSPRPTPPTRDPHTPGYVTAKELPDGENPPPDADGNFILGPTHNPAPEAVEHDGVPKGTVYEFTMSSTDSKLYPGIARDPGHVWHARSRRLRKADRHHQPSCALHAPRRCLRAAAVCSRHGRALHRRRRWARPPAVHRRSTT